MWFKALVALVALLSIFQIARNAVAQEAEASNAARFLWPYHPEVLKAVAMRGVGEAAAAGRVPTQSTMDHIRRLAIVAPHAAEPFLVEAALALKRGDRSRAERLLLNALRRQPRSAAGRFLLAELYVREGRLTEALVELARLTLIIPSSAVPLEESLEQFAQSGGTAAQLRQVFAVNPGLEHSVLQALATNPENAELIIAAASRTASASEGRAPGWQEKLLNGMIAREEYQKAYKLWGQLIGSSQGSAAGVFNPRYRRSVAPPPFNWSFTSSAAGVAEGEGGALHVMYYGSQNAVLAQQLLLLAPGSYQFKIRFRGDIPGENQLVWSLKCLPSREQVLAVALQEKEVPVHARFDVPELGCDAQHLELQGRAQEPARAADVQIGPILLSRKPK